ncbi:MAG: AAA family ATPase [Gammaproteobacteria bacterium]|nr:AAA family ATPase [Gammaproteobacteria bacterium]
MLLIRRIEITNFVCFDDIAIEPSTSREQPLTVIRAENGSGKTTLLRAIRWGMYGEKGLPGNASHFSLHPAAWPPDENGIETSVTVLFETDGSTRNHPQGKATNTVYELRRSVTTVAKESSRQGEPDFRRIGEEAQLLIQEPDGSWEPYNAGVDAVIEELLPSTLRDFFVMDADEAADFVGGARTRSLNDEPSSPRHPSPWAHC